MSSHDPRLFWISEGNRSSGGIIWTSYRVMVNGEVVYSGSDEGKAEKLFRDYAHGVEPLVTYEVRHQAVPRDPVTGKPNWDVIHSQREGGEYE